jgi:glycosyltransferase involved in cell wall biosynthesis
VVRIVQLNTHDATGGAARAAFRLHTALLRAGHDSRLVVANKSLDDATVEQWTPAGGLGHRLIRSIRGRRFSRQVRCYAESRPDGTGAYSLDRTPFLSTPIKPLAGAEIIQLHWVAGFLDSRRFLPKAARRAPIVWTLHDMNPLTGGCHYDDGCGRYQEACGSCPQLGSSDEGDLSHLVWRSRRAAYRGIRDDRLHIVTPSRWLEGAVRSSSLLGSRPVSTIPNGVDTEVFRPRDRAEARAALKLPAEAPVVLFVAASLASQRKGFGLLSEALRGVDTHAIHLVTVGRGDADPDIGVRHTHLGSIDTDAFLATVYCAADLYVIPSERDNLPNTVVESMACGTPVIGTDVGGIPELVRPRRTGLLVPVGDVAALRSAVVELLGADDARRAMAEECRRAAESEYSAEVQVGRYVELYQSLV